MCSRVQEISSRQQHVIYRQNLYTWRMQITSFYCRITTRELLRAGLDTSGIYAGTGLSSSEIDEVATINIDQFTDFLRNALTICDDPAFGIMIGTHTRLAGFGDMGVAALAAPTILDSLQVMETYGHLHSGLSTTSLTAKPHHLEVSVEHYRDDGFNIIYSEVFALLYQNFLEELLAESFVDGHYQFSHPEPDYAHQYQQKLHSTVEFNCAKTAVMIPQDITRQPSPYYDAGLWRHSLQQCAEQLNELSGRNADSYSAHVTRLLRSKHLPLPTLKSMASHLCLSERSLSRRLLEEETSYRQLVNSEMENRAKEYLSNTSLSIDAIAAELRYDDPANFRRAFRSWTEFSPSEFRTKEAGL